MGQVAGAAALCLKQGVTPRSLDPAALRNVLLGCGVI
jgi:hypothetical protein